MKLAKRLTLSNDWIKNWIVVKTYQSKIVILLPPILILFVVFAGQDT
jgi:hypothetical protein